MLTGDHQLVPVLSHMNPVHAVPCSFFLVCFKYYLFIFVQDLPMVFFLPASLLNPRCMSVHPMCVICPAPVSLLGQLMPNYAIAFPTIESQGQICPASLILGTFST